MLRYFPIMELNVKQPTIEIPLSANELSQDQEYILVDHGDFRKKVRIHDYRELYSVPGLYEQVVYNILQCQSPRVVTSLLRQQIAKDGIDPDQLNVLDVGAGNGIVAEELKNIGVDSIVGVDIIEEARIAAMRDRPDVYSGYLVADLAKADPQTINDLEHMNINCVTSVAAIGFGDIPPLTLANAIDIGSYDSWLALSIKEDFLKEIDSSGIYDLMNELAKEEIIDIKHKQKYTHRKSLSGNELKYDAIIARKNKEITAQILDNL